MKRIYLSLAALLAVVAVVYAFGLGSAASPPSHDDLSNGPVQSAVVADDSLDNVAAQRQVISAEADDDLETPEATAVVEERVTVLPEDGGKWHLTVFTRAVGSGAEEDRQVLKMFDQNADLAWLKEQTHFHHYYPGLRMYAKFQSSVTALPCVVLQDSAGRTVYKASGANLPRDPDQLAADVRQMIDQHHQKAEDCPTCPFRKTPDHAPTPRPQTPTTTVPDVMPTTTAATATDDFVASGLAALAALVGGALYQARRMAATI